MRLDAVELTQRLIAFDTRNPPGGEAAIASFLEEALSAAGFVVELYEFAPGRSSVVARMQDSGEGLRLAFAGHIDTVQLGETEWRHDPLGGFIDGDRLYGRGASDMKSGIAAMVSAAEKFGDAHNAGLELVLCAGEETGCEGAAHLAKSSALSGSVGGLVVGEPTSNRPVIAHKGALWLRGTAEGVASHGSMPHLGKNAIYDIAAAIKVCEEFRFDISAHQLLGPPTLNVGTVDGGLNINAVPDYAEFGIDIRTLPGQDLDQVIGVLQSSLPRNVVLSKLMALPAVESERDEALVELAMNATGVSDVSGISYFTDASILQHAYGGVPTVIIGPGEAEQAHRTNEFCLVSKIEEAAEIYLQMALSWNEAQESNQ
jgi:succinyl-diaminopimelate desuccinylase